VSLRACLVAPTLEGKMTDEEIKRYIIETVRLVVIETLEPKLHDLIAQIEGLNESLLADVQEMSNVLAPRLDVLARRCDRMDYNLRSLAQEIGGLSEAAQGFQSEVRATQEELREIRAMLEQRGDWGNPFHLN